MEKNVHKCIGFLHENDQQLAYAVVQGPQTIFFFFGKCFKKELLNIFSNVFFLFESTILPVNNGK